MRTASAPSSPAASSSSTTRLEAVARLTISNPERRNALDHDILNALAETMPKLDRGIEIRCVVITGDGELFSAGYDIAGIPDDTFFDRRGGPRRPSVPRRRWRRSARIRTPCSPRSTAIAWAAGSSWRSAATCGLCAVSAKLGMPPVKLGLIYSHTGLQKFIDVVGYGRTKELFLTGRNISGPRAMAIGLVNDTVPDDKLGDEAVALASEIAAGAPLSARGNKLAIETLNSYPRLTEEQERELIELRRSCFESEDFREGIRAFAEKRKPEWRGR